ncbi:MAG: hypothetical protein KJP11_08750 [Gammaproteobacteria bacterium]|nr:hypothetical protein [Gammaproteobacteria bacterium]
MISRFGGNDWFAGLLITIMVVFLSGWLSFKTDSMPGSTLKFTIEEAAAVRTIGANIQEIPVAVINKSLSKDAEPRCQSGAGFADAMKVLLKT